MHCPVCGDPMQSGACPTCGQESPFVADAGMSIFLGALSVILGAVLALGWLGG